MLPARILHHSVVVRELLPQDLKLEINKLTRQEAGRTSHYLGQVLGEAHARQLDSDTRNKWGNELRHHRPNNSDAPSWLWTSVVELIAIHEAAYLEHCRKYALADNAA
jgi:uncharacterized protein (DUF2252 family)